MSEQSVSEPRSDSQPVTAQPGSPTIDHGAEDTNRTVYSIIGFCSIGIVGCFFLPWIRLLFSDISGYDLQQLPGDEIKLLWLIPITGAISLVASITKQSVVVATQFAGAMPYLALIYYYAKFGQDIFQALRAGAVITLILGAVLIIAPRFLKK